MPERCENIVVRDHLCFWEICMCTTVCVLLTAGFLVCIACFVCLLACCGFWWLNRRLNGLVDGSEWEEVPGAFFESFLLWWCDPPLLEAEGGGRLARLPKPFSRLSGWVLLFPTPVWGWWLGFAGLEPFCCLWSKLLDLFLSSLTLTIFKGLRDSLKSLLNLGPRLAFCGF